MLFCKVLRRNVIEKMLFRQAIVIGNVRQGNERRVKDETTITTEVHCFVICDLLFVINDDRHSNIGGGDVETDKSQKMR